MESVGQHWTVLGMQNVKLTREAVVVTVGQLIVEHDWDCIVVVLELLLEGADLVLCNLQSRPAVPLEQGGFGQAAQATDKTTRGHGELELALI